MVFVSMCTIRVCVMSLQHYGFSVAKKKNRIKYGEKKEKKITEHTRSRARTLRNRNNGEIVENGLVRFCYLYVYFVWGSRIVNSWG